MHAPEYDQAADCGGGVSDHQYCGHRRVVQPPLAIADINTDAARAGYIDRIIAATHRIPDADANASTAYYLPDQHVYRDGSHRDVDGDPDGNDGEHAHPRDERADRPAANALGRASRAPHGPSAQ
jgi:hypothetical protein